MIVKCIVCEKPFEIEKGHAKYCSEECRKKGQYRKRKEWENRTGYREKQRKLQESYRVQEMESRAKEQKQTNALKRAEYEERAQRSCLERLRNLQEKAESGSITAQMFIALTEGDMLEYWRLRKEAILEEDYMCGRTSYFRVGEIEAHSEFFENQIVDKATERIHGEANRSGN